MIALAGPWEWNFRCPAEFGTSSSVSTCDDIWLHQITKRPGWADIGLHNRTLVPFTEPKGGCLNDGSVNMFQPGVDRTRKIIFIDDGWVEMT